MMKIKPPTFNHVYLAQTGILQEFSKKDEDMVKKKFYIQSGRFPQNWEF